MPKAKDPTRRREQMLEARKHTKGGSPVTNAEVKRRMEIVEEFHLRYRSKTKVVSLLSGGIKLENGDTFRLGKTAIERYYKRLEERWDQEAAPDRQRRQEWHRRALVSDIAAARNQNKWSPVPSLRRLLAEIDGVLAPQQHEHFVADASSIAKSITAGWTEEQKLAFVKTGEWPDADLVEHPGSNGANGGGNGAAH
jgi:hypothetical protein